MLDSRLTLWLASTVQPEDGWYQWADGIRGVKVSMAQHDG
jgi:hypothetical protein